MKIISPVNIDERKNLGIRSGDTVRVWQKITEQVKEKDKVKEKTRLQACEGLVIGVKHGTEAGSKFTVRRTASGVGMERIFPLYSPAIDSIEILRRAKVRRAKLYHVRHKAAKEITREMRKMIDFAQKEVVDKVKAKESAEMAQSEAAKAMRKASEAPEVVAEVK